MNSIEVKLAGFIESQAIADTAHDIFHIKRVVKSAKKICHEERALLEVVLPAAWLHDCVMLPKNHPDKKQASRLAADKAISFLQSVNYEKQYLPAIHHAIEAHSYSANVKPVTLEAKIIQDADRLDAIGAIGISRCMQISGILNSQLYASKDPFCHSREPDDRAFTIDHFYTKLLKLTDTMHTTSAKKEAKLRTAFMRSFLAQLGSEI